MCGFSNAQLTTSTNLSPTQLVTDVLAGNGVDISNVNFTGHNNAIGSFNGTDTNLGLDSGILLTSGTVLNTNSSGLFSIPEGPHGPNNSSTAGFINGSDGYQPLSDLVNEDTYDAAVLEFDFVPQSDTIRFKYVFGSEEYLENVDTEFNDVFAFFISGPGYPTPVNIATIPGTGGTPVSINNVNDNLNSAYYIDNGDGNEAPQNTSDFYIQYDGFTVVLEAVAKVDCGETYHLTIAIADAGDATWDSGIFIEASSLESYPPIEISQSSTLDLANNMIAEGCETGKITLSRHPSVANNTLTLSILTQGTATEGIDYDNLPGSVTFTPGQTSASFTFDIYNDNMIEGNESIIIKINTPDPCGNDNFTTVNLTIFDVDPLVVTIPEETIHCAGDEVTLHPIITGGVSAYTYEWENGVTSQPLTITPQETTTYILTVNDYCIASPVNASGTVNVPIYPPITLITTDDFEVLCPNTPMILAVEASGGESQFTYNWIENGISIGTLAVEHLTTMESTVYTIEVTDGCGTMVEKNINVIVTTPVLTIEMSPDQLICPGDSVSISVEADGGLGDFTYHWHHSQETNPEVTVTPSYSETYSVSVEDGCHSYHIDGETTVTIIRPYARFNVLSHEPMVGLPISFQNTSDGSQFWDWDFNNGNYSNQHSPNTTFENSGWIDVQLIATNEIGCKDTIQKTIYIKPEFYFYAPNAFTPDGNSFNNAYSVSVIGAKEIEFMIFNRWGDLIYSTTDIYFEWNGSYSGELAPDGVYVYRSKVTDMEGLVHEYYGTINLLR